MMIRLNKIFLINKILYVINLSQSLIKMFKIIETKESNQGQVSPRFKMFKTSSCPLDDFK